MYPNNPMPPQAPPPQPPRRRGRRLGIGCLASIGGLVVLIVVIAVIAGVATSGGNKSSGSSSGGFSPTPGTHGGVPGTGTPGIGQPVRDGKFQFTVTKVTHAKHVGGQFGDTAQGRYTILHLIVKNIGSESQTLDDSAQFVFDQHGRKYDASSAADLDLNSGGGVFLNDINPGNTVRGLIAFDMPAGAKAIKAELHDSLFSNGVTVNLGNKS